MVWWILTAVLCFVCLVAGIWVGHYLGWTDHQDELLASDAEREWTRLPPEKQQELSQNVIWAFRHVLQREPEPHEIKQWEKLNWPLRHLVERFITTEEFRRMTPERRFESRAAVERHFAGSAR